MAVNQASSARCMLAKICHSAMTKLGFRTLKLAYHPKLSSSLIQHAHAQKRDNVYRGMSIRSLCSSCAYSSICTMLHFVNHNQHSVLIRY